MTDYTAAQKLKWLESELSYRGRIYPEMVKRNQITQKTAKKQLAIMEAIAEDYREHEP